MSHSMEVRALVFSIAALLTAPSMSPVAVEASQQPLAQLLPTPTAVSKATSPPSAIAPSLTSVSAVTIEGTVRDRDGSRLVGVTVSAVPTPGQNLDASEVVSTDLSGRYSIGVAADDAALSGIVIDSATGASPGGRIFLNLSKSVIGATDQQTASVASTSANPDGSYTLSAASGTYADLWAYQVLSDTPQDGDYARRGTHIRAYTLAASNESPVLLTLPSLTVATPGCAAATCTLGVTGDGWAAVGVITLTLYQCNDVQCDLFTRMLYTGSVTADEAGHVNASVSFDAPPDGSYRLVAADDGSHAPTAHDVQTLASYVVSAHRP